MEDGGSKMEGGKPEAGSAEAGANRSGAPHEVSTKRRVAIGCFTSFLGFVSFAMVGALLSRFYAYLTKAAECDGIPACNWYIWWGIGGLIGAVTLPFLVLRVLGEPAKGAKSDRGF
jgi:hypothetical protein